MGTNIANITMSWFDALDKPSEKYVTLSDFCEYIKGTNDSFVPTIKRARRHFGEGNKPEYDRVKKSLPAVTISGIFSVRNQSEMIKYTQLLVLDIDSLSNIDMAVSVAKQRITRLPTTCVCFVSPSADGLKVIVRVETGHENHTLMFKSLMTYYEKETGIKIDGSGKDTSRLCFLSHDPGVYINFNCLPFTLNMDVDQRMKSARSVVDKRLLYPDHGRNNYVYSLSCITNKYGIEINHVEEYCVDQFEEHDFPQTEISKAIRSAYRNKEEHGCWSNQEFNFKSDDSLSQEQIEQARSILKIENLINELPVVLEVLVKDVSGQASSCQERLAANVSNALKLAKNRSCEQEIEKVIHTLIEHHTGSLDDAIGNRSPRGKFCTLIGQALRSDAIDQLTYQGKKIILWEYTLTAVKQAFDRELSLLTNVSGPLLESQIVLLRGLEQTYNGVSASLCLAYELVLKKNLELV